MITQRDENGIYGLREMVQYMLKIRPATQMQACEVGSWTGESALVFVSYLEIEKLTCIDPFDYNQVKDDPGCKNNKDDFEGQWEKFKERTMPYKNKIHVFKKTSRNAISYFGRQFDFVYLDASHQYGEVCHDINAWKRTIVHGGFICGHDYIGYREVYDAVRNSIGYPDCVFLDSSWVKRV